MNIRSYIIGCILSLLLSFWAIQPIFINGFFPMHDDTQIGRVVVMGRALREGQFPVRWVSDLGFGFGYPIYNFYGPLPYYVGGSFAAVGLTGLLATKIMFIIGILMASVAIFILIADNYGFIAGLLGAALYTYAPYHAVQLYVRGSVGEYWVLAFLPLLLFAVVRILKMKMTTKSNLLGIFAFAATIISHTILGYVISIFYILCLILFVLATHIKKSINPSKIKHLAMLFVLGIGVSCFFWLPAVLEAKYTNVALQIGPTANFRDHFVCLHQLWDSPWGFGGSAPGCVDGLSFKIGKFHLFIAFFSVLVWVLKGRFSLKNSYIWNLGMVFFILSIFLMSTYSQMLWDILPQFTYIQYPWRFLTFTNIGIALLSVGIWNIFPSQKTRILGGLFLITIVILLNVKLFTPQTILKDDALSWESLNELRYRVSKISSEYLPPSFIQPRDISEIRHDTIAKSDGIIVSIVHETDTYSRYEVTTQNPSTITINKVYFPGWKYRLNGNAVIPTIVNALPQLNIAPGNNIIELRFEDTPIRTLGNLISIFTLLYLLFYYGRKIQ